MVQNEATGCTMPPVRPQSAKKPGRKTNNKSNDPTRKVLAEKAGTSIRATTVPDENGEPQRKFHEREQEGVEEERRVTSLAQYLRARRVEERLAKERQAEEDRERFVKEAAERKAAEREEVIRRAKKLILYRKPMCRRINQGLLISECLRELDAQLKFRETLRNTDKEAEIGFVKLMKEDVAKYEEETREKAARRMEIRRNYIADLKKQIEEKRTAAMIKEREEFEADRQDQINMVKRLEDTKEYEAQQLLKKKEKLRRFFKDAIEEKKQFDLQLKHEEEFVDRANEIYRSAKERVQKMQKTLGQREREERENRARSMGNSAERYRTCVKSTTESEEKIYKKVIEEQEQRYQDNRRNEMERQDRARKEIRDCQARIRAAKSKQLEDENELKMWETMQRFKKVERDREREAEERKRAYNEKLEYGKALKKYAAEKEAREKLEKLDTEQAADLANKLMEKENQRVLDYADEVLKESHGVRPLYPIHKALEDCKKQMGLMQPKQRGELHDPEPKKRRKIPLRCTKYVPEEKVLYL